jgi:hypothetical protein
MGKRAALDYTIDMGSLVSWQRDWPAAALAVAALVLAAPLWCVTTPAMPDYPAHLASFWLIGGGASDPLLAKAYAIHWGFIPNLASELLVPVLAKLAGVTLATKLFLTAAVLMWVLGPGAVHRALYGRWSIAPLLGAAFAYNANFSWGFFNYYFASGLAFLVFAAWIACRRKTLPWLCGFAAAVTLVYFCHIFAAATLALMIAAYEAAMSRRDRDVRELLLRAAHFAIIYVPAAIAFVFLRPASAGDARLEFNLAENVPDKLESLVAHAFDNPSYAIPFALLAGLALAVHKGHASVHPAMRGLVAVLFVAALAAPEWAMGGWAVHLRLPAVVAAMLFAGAEFHFDTRITRALGGAALAMIAWLAIGLGIDWRGYDRQVTEFRAAESAIPRGARLVTVLDGNAIGMASDQPYWHMAEFAIIDRAAFTPLMFTTGGQHVVQLHEPYRSFAAATAQQGSPPDIDELPDLANGVVGDDVDIRTIFPYLLRFPCHFDQALVIHLGGARSPVPDMLRLAHAGSFFSLYDIVPGTGCART